MMRPPQYEHTVVHSDYMIVIAMKSQARAYDWRPHPTFGG